VDRLPSLTHFTKSSPSTLPPIINSDMSHCLSTSTIFINSRYPRHKPLCRIKTPSFISTIKCPPQCRNSPSHPHPICVVATSQARLTTRASPKWRQNTGFMARIRLWNYARHDSHPLQRSHPLRNLRIQRSKNTRRRRLTRKHRRSFSEIKSMESSLSDTFTVFPSLID
jgi:hypothetical protein